MLPVPYVHGSVPVQSLAWDDYHDVWVCDELRDFLESAAMM
ncbi:MAG: hypothetical protein ABFS56_34040 [Pseudomonadota bacterium]